jgi:hypothetical protein
VNDRPKVEPSAEIRGAAASLFELYVALVDSGFSETQALTLLQTMLPRTDSA